MIDRNIYLTKGELQDRIDWLAGYVVEECEELGWEIGELAGAVLDECHLVVEPEMSSQVIAAMTTEEREQIYNEAKDISKTYEVLQSVMAYRYLYRKLVEKAEERKV